LYACDQILHRFVGEPWMNRQGDEAIGEGVGDGELSLAEAALLKCRAPVQGQCRGM